MLNTARVHRDGGGGGGGGWGVANGEVMLIGERGEGVVNDTQQYL